MIETLDKSETSEASEASERSTVSEPSEPTYGSFGRPADTAFREGRSMQSGQQYDIGAGVMYSPLTDTNPSQSSTGGQGRGVEVDEYTPAPQSDLSKIGRIIVVNATGRRRDYFHAYIHFLASDGTVEKPNFFQFGISAAGAAQVEKAIRDALRI